MPVAVRGAGGEHGVGACAWGGEVVFLQPVVQRSSGYIDSGYSRPICWLRHGAAAGTVLGCCSLDHATLRVMLHVWLIMILQSTRMHEDRL